MEGTDASPPGPVAEAVAAPKPTPPATPTRRWVLGGAFATAVAGTAVAALLWRQRNPPANPHVAGLLGQGRDALRMELNDYNKKAVELFQQAVGIEPGNAAAQGLLALAYARAAEYGSTPALELGEQAFRVALALDEHEPTALVARALLWRGHKDWFWTHEQLDGVLQHDGNHVPALEALSSQMQSSGFSRTSWDLNVRIRKLDDEANQSWPGIDARRAFLHWIFGETPQAVEAAHVALRRWSDPAPHPYVWQNMLVVYAYTGEFGKARSMLAKAHGNGSRSEAFVSDWLLALDALESRSRDAIARVDDEVRRHRQSPGRVGMPDVHRIMLLSELNLIETGYVEFFRYFNMDADQIVPAVPAKRSDHNPAWRLYQWVFCPAMRNLRRDARFGEWSRKKLLDAYWNDLGKEPDEGRLYTGPLEPT
jgi:tetratricopeptide (TPR) repeat protein